MKKLHLSPEPRKKAKPIEQSALNAFRSRLIIDFIAELVVVRSSERGFRLCTLSRSAWNLCFKDNHGNRTKLIEIIYKFYCC
jgi:hypothetical protein